MYVKITNRLIWKPYHALFNITQEICFTLNPIFQGTVLGITGPTLTEMTLKLKSTYEEISLAYSLKEIGMLVGAPFGGHVTDKFRF